MLGPHDGRGKNPLSVQIQKVLWIVRQVSQRQNQVFLPVISTRLNDLPRCTVILNGIDAYMTVCGFGCRAWGLALTYHLDDYQRSAVRQFRSKLLNTRTAGGLR